MGYLLFKFVSYCGVYFLTFWYAVAIVFLCVYEENLSINCCAHYAIGGGYSVYTDVVDK